MNEFVIGDINFNYRIDWGGERKTLGFEVLSSKEIIIKAPQSLTDEEIGKALEAKKSWILGKVKEIKKQTTSPLDKEFLSGEKLTYNGRLYRLKVIESKKETSFKFVDSQFILRLNNCGKNRKSKAKKLAADWYIKRAEKQLTDKLDNFSKKMNISYDKLEVREIKKYWGTVKSRNIKLNWHLILAPVQVQDYIIVHELAHISEGEHNSKFWNIVGAVIPDYEKRKMWLKENGILLNI